MEQGLQDYEYEILKLKKEIASLHVELWELKKECDLKTRCFNLVYNDIKYLASNKVTISNVLDRVEIIKKNYIHVI